MKGKFLMEICLSGKKLLCFLVFMKSCYSFEAQRRFFEMRCKHTLTINAFAANETTIIKRITCIPKYYFMNSLLSLSFQNIFSKPNNYEKTYTLFFVLCVP